MEVERDQDRVRRRRTLSVYSTSSPPEELLAEMLALAAEAAPASEAVPQVREFAKRLDRVRQKSSVGYLLQSSCHRGHHRADALSMKSVTEPRPSGRFLRKAAPPFRDGMSESFEKSRISAVSAVGALERLADRFAPLASSNLQAGQPGYVLEEANPQIQSNFSSAALRVRN